jgi:hypothetical protein
MIESDLNDRILKGLANQFSPQRIDSILAQAYALFAKDHTDANRPEVYELYESGYVDRSLDSLGLKWVVGRPSKATPTKPSFRPSPIRKPQANSEIKETESNRTLDSLLADMLPETLPKAEGIHDNAIIHLNLVIFAKADAGKTNIGECVLEAISKRYGMANVCGLRSSRDLPAIFQNLSLAFQNGTPRALVLFFDDMDEALSKLTGSLSIRGGGYMDTDPLSGGLSSFHGTVTERQNQKAFWLDKFYDIRGELAKRGMREGLVVMVTSVHRFYSTPLEMRDADLVLCRTTPLAATYDARVIEKMLGSDVYETLTKHESKALKDRSELDYTAYRAKIGSGIVRIPRAISSYMRTVTSKEQARKPATWTSRIFGPLLVCTALVACCVLVFWGL